MWGPGGENFLKSTASYHLGVERALSHDRKSKVLAELKSDRSSVPCRTAVLFSSEFSVHFEKPNARGQTS